MKRSMSWLAVVVTVAAACSSGGTEPSGTATTVLQPTTVDVDAPPTSTVPPTSSGDAASAPTTTAGSPATTPTATTPPGDRPDLTVASLNVLHGLAAASDCAPETDHCRAPTRIDLLWTLIEDEAGCPDIVGLQEISTRQQELVPAQLDRLCDGRYQLLHEPLGLPDQEMILTTLPVVADARVELAGGPVWSSHWAQLESELGTVDVISTHFASSSLNPPCAEVGGLAPCSESCAPTDTLGDCHPVQTLELLDERSAPDSYQLVIGDLNGEPDGTRLATLLDAGFVDTHLAAGNPECGPDQPRACTCCVEQRAPLGGLDDPGAVFDRRIDFVLVRPPATSCGVSFADDGDRFGTGTWAITALVEPRDELYFTSDHGGARADVNLDDC